MTIGKALKQLRLHAGLTQDQMAAGIISESYYSKVERDIHNIDAKLLIDILRVHGFDVISFFNKIYHQPAKSNPDFEFMTQIDQAKKKKDLERLNKITCEIQNRGVQTLFLCTGKARISLRMDHPFQ